MEKPPKNLGEEVVISPDLKDDLYQDEIEKYKEIKFVLKDVFSRDGIWSPEFSVWIDNNLRYFGMLGKAIEAIGKFRSKKPPKLPQPLEHYKRLYEATLDKCGAIPAGFKEWVEKSSGDSLGRVGELFDVASAEIYVAVSTNRAMKKLQKENPNFFG